MDRVVLPRFNRVFLVFHRGRILVARCRVASGGYLMYRNGDANIRNIYQKLNIVNLYLFIPYQHFQVIVFLSESEFGHGMAVDRYLHLKLIPLRKTNYADGCLFITLRLN